MNEVIMWRYRRPALLNAIPQKTDIEPVWVKIGKKYLTETKSETKYIKEPTIDSHGIPYYSQAGDFEKSILLNSQKDAEKRFEYDKIRIELNRNDVSSRLFKLPLDLLKQINVSLENGDKDRISEYVIPQHRISTPLKDGLGTLCAEIGGDPDYPEIFTYVERPDGIQIDCCAVSQNGHSDGVTIYRWLDTSTDAYTDSAVISAENINIEA